MAVKLLNRFLNSMKLEDDDYDDEEEFEPDEEFDDLDYSEEPKSVKVSAPPIFSKKEKVEDDFEDDLDEDEEPAPRKNFFKSKKQPTTSNVVPMRRNSMEVCMIKPNSMGETKDIVEVLCSGRAVVINMEGVNLELAQRIIDFASGAVYAINGKLQAISTSIYIITPKNIDLTGDFAGSIGGGSGSISYNI